MTGSNISLVGATMGQRSHVLIHAWLGDLCQGRDAHKDEPHTPEQQERRTTWSHLVTGREAELLPHLLPVWLLSPLIV